MKESKVINFGHLSHLSKSFHAWNLHRLLLCKCWSNRPRFHWRPLGLANFGNESLLFSCCRLMWPQILVVLALDHLKRRNRANLMYSQPPHTNAIASTPALALLKWGTDHIYTGCCCNTEGKQLQPFGFFHYVRVFYIYILQKLTLNFRNSRKCCGSSNK